MSTQYIMFLWTNKKNINTFSWKNVPNLELCYIKQIGGFALIVIKWSIYFYAGV